MIVLLTICLILHTMIIIAAWITAWFIYSTRGNAHFNEKFTDYMWNDFEIYLWLLTAITVLYPILLFAYITSLFGKLEITELLLSLKNSQE